MSFPIVATPPVRLPFDMFRLLLVLYSLMFGFDSSETAVFVCNRGPPRFACAACVFRSLSRDFLELPLVFAIFERSFRLSKNFVRFV